MDKSESITEIAKALCAFQGAMEPIKKDAENPFFKSKYASLANIIEDTRKPLSDNGLSYVQFPCGEFELVTMLMHSSGEWLKASYKMAPVDNRPQSLGSAITYQRRYALSSILGLQVEDDDGQAASTKKDEKKEAKKETKKEVETPFNAARRMIEDCESQKDLETLMSKIDESKKLDEEDKQSLKEIADARMDIIFDEIGQHGK